MGGLTEYELLKILLTTKKIRAKFKNEINQIIIIRIDLGLNPYH